MADFRPDDWPTFIETRAFSDKWKRLGLDDDAMNRLQVAIARDPESHPVMAGTGGLRKVRFADPRSNRGKRGSFRCCYVYISPPGSVYFVAVFGKNEKSNLGAAEKADAASMIRGFRSEREGT